MAFRFRPHRELEGRHAFLSPSKYHWVNYSPEKLVEKFENHMTAALGTRLHAWAKEAIEMGLQQQNNSKTINLYINDCIGFRMETEVPLAYSDNAFGCADAISFTPDRDSGRMMLRIFDLKNGVSPASVHQLECYAALFCLEYAQRPGDLLYDLRIYQNDDIAMFETDPEDIMYIMDRYIEFNKLIELAKEEV